MKEGKKSSFIKKITITSNFQAIYVRSHLLHASSIQNKLCHFYSNIVIEKTAVPSVDVLQLNCIVGLCLK